MATLSLSDEQALEFIRRARDQGVSDAEITKTLASGSGWDRSGGKIGAFARGANTGMAQLAGAPVDLMTGVINSNIGAVPQTSPYSDPAAQKPIVNPVGGSQSFMGGMNWLLGPRTTYESRANLPPDERPFAAAGETFGGGLGTLPLARAIPAAANALRSSPKAFMGAEGAGIVGSTLGAGESELLFPENPGARMAFEMGGGLLHPGALAARGSAKFGQGLKAKITGPFTQAGREQRAADLLQKTVLAGGEDPEAVVQALRQPTLTGKLSAGQLSESPALLSVENLLARENKKYGGQVAGNAQGALSDLRGYASELSAKGDPAALRSAAAVRRRYFSDIVKGRIDLAEKRARSSIAGKTGQADAQEFSVAAERELDAAMRDGRMMEREQWAAVPKDIALKSTNTVAAYDRLRETILDSEKILPLVEPEIARLKSVKPAGESVGFTPDGVPVLSAPGATPETAMTTSGDLLRLRQKTLEFARQARGARNWDHARLFQGIADGALDDLSTMPGDAANSAREFSRAFNDAFSRTFAGDALALKPSGAQRIAPEQMLEKALGSGGAGGDVRLRGLQQGADFPGSRGGATDYGPAMRSQQENFLSASAQKLLDPNTGRVSADKLQKFLADNEATLNRFPELRGQLSNSANAERALQDAQRMGDVSSRAIQQRAVFSRLLGQEEPEKVVSSILTGKAPEREYAQLVRLAERGGPGAKEGLKAASLDWAGNQATDATGNFSFDKYRQALTQPLRKDGLNLLSTMELHGVMSKGESARLQSILAEAGKIERGLASHARLDAINDLPSALYDLVVRITGAKIGSYAAKLTGGGGSIIAPHAGSMAARQMFEKVPSTRIRDVLTEALQDPKATALLLEKPASAKRAKDIGIQLSAFLLQSGLTSQAGE